MSIEKEDPQSMLSSSHSVCSAVLSPGAASVNGIAERSNQATNLVRDVL